MKVIGVCEDGSTAFVRQLDHGADPRVLSHDLGFFVVGPLDARRGTDGVLELRLKVQELNGQPRPWQSGLAGDPGLDLSTVSNLEVRQRVAAYALVTSRLGLLATEFSARTSVPGQWGLPGGGIDGHEEPDEAVLREVTEETGQVVDLGKMVEVQTSHWVGRSPRDTIEDYHAVRLVYEAHCPGPTTPVVADVGGTTESARWVPLTDWSLLPWTAGWRSFLSSRLG